MTVTIRLTGPVGMRKEIGPDGVERKIVTVSAAADTVYELPLDPIASAVLAKHLAPVGADGPKITDGVTGLTSV